MKEKCNNCGKTKGEHFTRNVRYRELRDYWQGITKSNKIMSTFVEQRLFCFKYGRKEFEQISKELAGVKK